MTRTPDRLALASGRLRHHLLSGRQSMSDPFLHHFEALGGRHDGLPPAELAHAALGIGLLQEPELRFEPLLARLEAYADQVRTRISPDMPLTDRWQLLDAHFFSELGFHGATRNYYDPRNSFLDHVLVEREGIPVSLAVLYMDLAGRLNLRTEGVGFPGHFLVRRELEQGSELVDVFSDAAVVSLPELEARLAHTFPEQAPSLENHPEFLRPVSSAEILLRMLRNLKGIYAAAGEGDPLLRILHAILSLAPDSISELRERGDIYRQMDYRAGALRDLSRAAQLGGADPELEHQIGELRIAPSQALQ
ncbi:MAG: transglutaminase-like domain-containing protein [Gammaproteobacteria bacterium]|nr:transglutaminase-like domain-containing protein [Gammaproteobacteria bacterium]